RRRRGLADRLGITQALLLLRRIDDRAAGPLVLPEDQAVDEGVVLARDGARVGIDLAADVGVDAALAGFLHQRLLGGVAGAGARRLAGLAGVRLLNATGECGRQRLLGLVARRDFLRTRLARPRRT